MRTSTSVAVASRGARGFGEAPHSRGAATAGPARATSAAPWSSRASHTGWSAPRPIARAGSTVSPIGPAATSSGRTYGVAPTAGPVRTSPSSATCVAPPVPVRATSASPPHAARTVSTATTTRRARTACATPRTRPAAAASTGIAPANRTPRRSAASYTEGAAARRATAPLAPVSTCVAGSRVGHTRPTSLGWPARADLSLAASGSALRAARAAASS